MNKTRRKKLEWILSDLETVRDEIENVKEDEQEAFDNLPESIQYSEKGEQMEMNVSDLEELYESIDTAIYNLNELLENC